MQIELEKLVSEIQALSLSHKQFKQLHQYQDKLDELEDFVDKHENDGIVHCMINATESLIQFKKQASNDYLHDFNYFKARLKRLTWKNEGLEKNGQELLDILEQLRKIKEKNNSIILYALIGIAGVEYQKGNFESTLHFLNQAKPLLADSKKQNPSLNQATVRANLHNLFALSYMDINLYKKAGKHFKKSLSILKLYKDESSLEAPKLAVLNNIGNIFIRQRQWREGLEYFEIHYPYFKSRLQNASSDHIKSMVAYFLVNMSLCCVKLSEVESCEEKLSKLKKVVEDIKGGYPHLYAGYLFSRSMFNNICGNFEPAIQNAQTAFELVFADFKSTGIADNPKIKREDCNKMQSLVLQPFIAKTNALLAWYERGTQNLELLNICLDAIDKIGFYFDTVRTNYTGQSTKFSLGYFSQGLFHIGQLACWYLYKSTSKIEYAEKAFAYANNSKALVLLEEMHKKWLSDTEIIYSIEQIQSIINSNETILEYSLGEKGIFVYLLSENEPIQFNYINADDTKQIEQQVKHWLKHHFNIYQPNQHEAYQQSVYAISKQLILPYIKNITSETTLIIAPDGFLNALPFEALVNKINTIQSYTEINYLIDNYTFAYTFSSYLLYINRQTNYSRVDDDFLYLSPNFLGNKTLEEHHQTQKEQAALLEKVSLTEMDIHSPPVIPYLDDQLDLSLIDDEQIILISKAALYNLINKKAQQAPAPLLHNALLIPKLSGMLDEYFSRMALAENNTANTTTYQKQSITADYILIASHAETDKGILLYGQNGKEFTYLNYNEIIAQNLNAQLVILNMCDSGRGKSVLGEGYLSLGRAFFAAGSLNVIQTLYKVSDKYSANLIASFFGFLTMHQLDYYAALRQAKLSLRKEMDSHPKFWAGHVIYGKNGELAPNEKYQK